MATRFFVSFFFFIVLMTSMAQTKGLDAHGNKKASYYLDISSTVPAMQPNSLDMADSSLDIQYHDYIGKAKILELKIVNWKKETVSAFQLEKEFGLNFFHIPLSPMSLGIVKDQIYSLEILDEQKHKHSILIKWITPVVPKMVTDIVVNPRFLECGYKEGNIVEFYADISGGKAPYTVNWYVMNEHRTELLYQPRSEKIPRPGKSASIMVDQSPDYYVLILAVDACGNESKQTVHLSCEEGKKKINTLFLYPLDNLGKVKTGN